MIQKCERGENLLVPNQMSMADVAAPRSRLFQ